MEDAEVDANGNLPLREDDAADDDDDGFWWWEDEDDDPDLDDDDEVYVDGDVWNDDMWEDDGDDEFYYDEDGDDDVYVYDDDEEYVVVDEWEYENGSARAPSGGTADKSAVVRESLSRHRQHAPADNPRPTGSRAAAIAARPAKAHVSATFMLGIGAAHARRFGRLVRCELVVFQRHPRGTHGFWGSVGHRLAHHSEYHEYADTHAFRRRSGRERQLLRAHHSAAAGLGAAFVHHFREP